MLRDLAGLTYSVQTFGCQMNEHDTERVSGMLEERGALLDADPDTADIVVYMTCCVREAADTRVFGRIASMKNLPDPASGLRTIAVGGCIGQRDAEGLFERLPNVDVVFGTQTISEVIDLIASSRGGEGRQVSVTESSESFSTDLPSRRDVAYKAWLPITFGCNNYCTYCIVPYVRGRERSRMLESVVEEARQLVTDGVLEITLLGQNVNSYGRDLYGEPRFAELLHAVADTGIERIRFATSHPKDLSPATIDAIATIPAVMPQLHLPVQAGSDRILRAMNRTYTNAQYRDLVARIRAAVPDIALSTDIIVGFPGETEEDFEETLKLAEDMSYSQAFTFIYSKREGTPAARLEDETPREVIQERFDRLVAVIQRSALHKNEKDTGARLPVLFDGTSKRDDRMLVGKSPKNQTVHVPLPAECELTSIVGTIRDVEIREARTWYLIGELVCHDMFSQ